MNQPHPESLEFSASVFLLVMLLGVIASLKLYRRYWALAAVILVELASRFLYWAVLASDSPAAYKIDAWGYYVLDVLKLAALAMCVYQLARAPGSRS